MKWLLEQIGFSPYMILAVIAAGTGLFFFGRYEGGHAQRLEDAAAALKTVTVEIAAVHQEEIKFNLISTNVEKKLEDIHVVHDIVTREVDKIIDRPIYSNVCIDDDGLRLIREALSATPTDLSKSRPALSVDIPTGRRDGKDAGTHPH